MQQLAGDLRVIDLSSGPAGGVATMVLADFGADVIKVERPGGDPLRRLPASPMWLRGKRSVELDLTSEAGRERLHRLAGGADVVVASYRPGQAEQLGADYETLAIDNPGLVYCSITAFGPRGPYAGYAPYEGVVSAKSGRMQSFTGQPRREGPAYTAVQVGVHATSQSAVNGILGALLARERDGKGQLVETSLLQGMFPPDLFGLVRTQLARRYPRGFEGDPYARFEPMPTLQYHPVVASDGRWIQLANLLEHHFHAYISAIGLSEIYADPRFVNAPTGLTPETRRALSDLMLERMQDRSLDEWMELFQADGQIASEPVQSAQDGLLHPDLEANDEVVAFEHPRHGPVRQLGPIAQLSETPGEAPRWFAEPGEHTQELLAEPPRAPWQPANGAAPSDRPPLEGVTIVEFGTIIAAPLGITFLADLGARVIKVEAPEGDPYRGMGYGLGSFCGIAKTSAGKESICIDLKREEGRAVVHKMLEGADAVMHNFRPGVPERLGIGYEQVREIRPDVVYLQVNGYGPKGPSAARPSAHPIPGAATGGQLYQAGAAMPPPEVGSIPDASEAARWLYRANEGNPDPNTGCVVQNAMMLGLYAQQRFGIGQLISMSMLGANAYANSDDFLSYEGKAPRPTVDADLYGINALYRLYPASEGWVFLGVVTDGEWATFTEVSGRGDLASDPRFTTHEARGEHDTELCEELRSLFTQRSALEWEQLLAPLGVGCVQADGGSPGEFFADDPQIEANGWDLEAEHTLWGRYRRHGPQVTLSRTSGSYRAGALAGEHGDALLAELGYDASEVASLREQRVVTSEPLFDPAEYDPPGVGFP